MYYTTYATLNETGSTLRLASLVKALEAQHCQVKLNLPDMRLELGIPDDRVWWVLTGCITVFFEGFKDVASWSFKFHSDQRAALAAA